MATEHDDEYVLEASIHLFGEDHAFREVFHPDEEEAAKQYVEEHLASKFEGEMPPGEWQEVGSPDQLVFWPGRDHDIGDDDWDVSWTPNSMDTKGYVIRKPLRINAQDALADHRLNPQIMNPTEATGLLRARLTARRFIHRLVPR